jgi:hypothetical protein
VTPDPEIFAYTFCLSLVAGILPPELCTASLCRRSMAS